ncbi:RHS repeat-associated core domain-containing protein, partial [Streptomyces sp. NRRL F-2664]|uniref:RHS repeat-associated core domain-containing protein n=1 Tax=Streptomyces sp. NRRL F-2664 TaxID=1463842 RepID=UPI00131C334B
NGPDYPPARLYHPETGRFTTRDPHPTPLNKYQAFNTNPAEYTDPTGNITFRVGHRNRAALPSKKPSVSQAQMALMYEDSGRNRDGTFSEKASLALPPVTTSTPELHNDLNPYTMAADPIKSLGHTGQLAGEAESGISLFEKNVSAEFSEQMNEVPIKGGAGILLRHTAEDGVQRFLVAGRSAQVRHLKNQTANIGGMADSGETYWAAATRELSEETGMDLASFEPISLVHVETRPLGARMTYRTFVVEVNRRAEIDAAKIPIKHAWENDWFAWVTKGDMRTVHGYPLVRFLAEWIDRV